MQKEGKAGVRGKWSLSSLLELGGSSACHVWLKARSWTLLPVLYLFEHWFNFADAVCKSSVLGAVPADLFRLMVHSGYDWVNRAVAGQSEDRKKDEPPLQFVNWGYIPTDDVLPLNRALKAQTPLLEKALWGKRLDEEEKDEAARQVQAKRRCQQLAANLHCVTLVSPEEEGKHDPNYLNGKRVLEVGCGRGGGAAVLHALAQPSSYTGIDMLQSSIIFCKEENKEELEKRTFLTGRAEGLDGLVNRESFDVVFNVESSHCYRDFQAFVDGVYRALVPGGLFLWTDQRVDRNHSFAKISTIDHCFTCFDKAGFTVQKVYDIRPNVILSLNEGSLGNLGGDMDAGSKGSLVLKFVTWFSIYHRPNMLKVKRIDYHIVVLSKPKETR